MPDLDAYGHNPDPDLAELLHTVVEDGWGNQTIGDLAQTGWQATLLIVEPQEQPELAEVFDREIPTGNFLVTQREHGYVTVDAYPTPQVAHRAFDDLTDPDAIPDEDDATITPTGPLGALYAVALGGRFLGTANDLRGAYAKLRAAMNAEGVWPDVWWVSDHGNAHRITLPDL